MTAPSRDGRDKPFCDWLRNHPELESYTRKLYSNDVDQVFCKYKTNVDGCGTREVKLMLEVETKCFGAYPDPEQSEVLFFRHQLLQRKGRIVSNLLKRQVSVWHFGQYVLQLCEGERPDKCSGIKWGRFDDAGKLILSPITEKQLINILRFDHRPDTGERLSLRRHHKTRKVTYEERRGMLFPVERTLTFRS